MPSVFGGSSSGAPSGVSSPSITANKPKKKVTGAGQVAVSISDPTTTLAQSAADVGGGLVGVGKGLVSLAENLPVVGAVAKPIIGGVGTIADATIGNVVKAAEGVKIGDSSLAQIVGKPLEIAGNVTTAALDVLSAPARFTEQKVAEAKIRNTLSGKTDAISLLFGDAPAAAVNSVRAGGSIEDAAIQLANSNAGFSENGALNFLYSAVIDPLNLVAFGAGKFSSVGKAAAQAARRGAGVGAFLGAEGSNLTRIAVGNLRDLAAKNVGELAAGYAAQADFLEKYGLVGRMYESTLGKLDRKFRNQYSNVVKETATSWTRVYSAGLKGIDTLLDELGVAAGKEVVERGLKNVATTAANAVKSGAVRAGAITFRSRGQDFADSLITFAIESFQAGKNRAAILAEDLGDGLTYGAKLAELGVPDTELTKLLDAIEEQVGKGVRADEIRRVTAVSDAQEQIGRIVGNLYVSQNRKLILEAAKTKVAADAKLAAEDAFRILSEAKMDVVPLANNPALGIEELAKDLAAGFGISPELALERARAAFARHEGDLRSLTDILAFARDAAFGQTARELAAVRRLFDPKDFLARVTVTSVRSLTESRAKELIDEADRLEAIIKAGGDGVAAAKQELRALADSIVRQYDEFSVFSGTDYGYEQVIQLLRKSKSLTVREITDKERAIILQRAKEAGVREVLDLEKRLGQLGYRLGIAPKEGLTKVRTMVPDRLGREKFVEVLTPFSDTLDHIAIGELDQGLARQNLRPSGLSRLAERFTRAYGTEVTQSKIAERFVTEMVKKTGISVNRARQLMSEISILASKIGEQGVQPKALFMERQLVDEIFGKELVEKLAKKGSSPIQEIIRAAAGDLSSAGLTSGFTGRVKAIFPQITVMTDRLYPEARFGVLNPFFNLVLERIETGIQLFVHNVRREAADEAVGQLRGTALLKAYTDPRNVNREISDGLMYMRDRATRNTIAATQGSPSFRKRLAEVLRSKFNRGSLSIRNVQEAKTLARDIMADRFASRELADNLERVAPGVLNKLAVHYGVQSADDVLELLLADYLIQSDPIQFSKYMKANRAKNTRIAQQALVAGGLDPKVAEEIAATTMAVFDVTMERASRAANKAQYFASHRTWFERSINHPFLAIYPYSYMTQKAIPSLLTIMFKPTIAGTVMPGTGYVLWENVTEWMDSNSNTDPDVIKQILQDDAVLYVFTTLLPVTPDRVGFSMPAWLRRGIIQPGLRGDQVNLGTVGQTLTEVGAQVVRGTVLGQTRSVLEGIQGVEDTVQANETLGNFIQSQRQDIQQRIQDSLLNVRNP